MWSGGGQAMLVAAGSARRFEERHATACCGTVPAWLCRRCKSWRSKSVSARIARLCEARQGRLGRAWPWLRAASFGVARQGRLGRAWLRAAGFGVSRLGPASWARQAWQSLAGAGGGSGGKARQGRLGRERRLAACLILVRQGRLGSAEQCQLWLVRVTLGRASKAG
jgi:hypothetical protein